MVTSSITGALSVITCRAMRRAGLSAQLLIDLTIASSYDQLALVSAAVDPVLQGLCPDSATAENVGLAVHEAVVNAIQHGNGEDPRAIVTITLEIVEDELIIGICDQGPGFDPGNPADPGRPDTLMRPQGRGLFLIRHAVDRRDTARTPEGRAVLILRTKIPPHHPQTAVHTTIHTKEDQPMAQLSMSQEQHDDITILRAAGKITIGEGSVQLREGIRSLLEEDNKKILLDLGQVTYVDSSGIGELVSSYTTTNGGQLKLLNPTKRSKICS